MQVQLLLVGRGSVTSVGSIPIYSGLSNTKAHAETEIRSLLFDYGVRTNNKYYKTWKIMN